jgi:hypothetical protein
VPPAPAWLLVGVVGLVLLATNLFVQYGLTHTPANRAIVIFLFELVVAALASWLLAGEAMTAAGMARRRHDRRRQPVLGGCQPGWRCSATTLVNTPPRT